MLNIFIGYDPREAVAYHVCSNSIIRHASKPVNIIPVALKSLKDYNDADRKVIDGYPQTNQFIFSRFLVPHLLGYKGVGLFIDGDMIVTDDIVKLFDLFDPQYAVQVVKHDYKTKYPIKYLNQANKDYPRKNWSSVMLFNCEHEDNKKLTLDFVNNATGEQLHRLTWTDAIGELPPEWNWLADEYGEYKGAKLIHYTAGTPCFHEFAETPMAALWHKERMLTDYSMQTNEGL